MHKIAIYGKGGIGKSTTAANLSAAMIKKGLRVMQIGCDPKSDSTKTLMGGRQLPTVLDQMKEKKDDIVLSDIVYQSKGGVYCVEAGGPTPGIGCAGRGIITAFEKLEELGAYDTYQPDVVFYDVLGDVVCGGFAMPIRGGYADKVFIVTSGEMMSLYAASNIVSAIQNFGKRGYAQCGGLILNRRNVENEDALVEQLAGEADIPVLGRIPRDPLVAQAEKQNTTVVDLFPDSDLAHIYCALADKLLEVCGNGTN